jgi:hypothetical protein
MERNGWEDFGKNHKNRYDLAAISERAFLFITPFPPAPG